MAIRDFFIFVIVMSMLPLCVWRPYIGVLAWSWLGYMNPHRLTWGSAHYFGFAQWVAAATLLGFVIHVVTRGFPKVPRTRETVMLFLLWVMYTVTTIAALRPDLAWPEWHTINKILLMTVLTMLMVDSVPKLRILLLVIALSLGFYGFKGGLWIAMGNTGRIWGPQGSFIADNNGLGLALNMTLPMLFFLARGEPNRKLRIFLQVTFFFSVLSVLFTYSRGAFLGLSVVTAYLFFSVTMRTKIVMICVMLVAIPVIFAMLPDTWFSRMGTLQTFEEDRSAMSRIEAWTTAYRLALDRPLIGGGFQIIDDRLTHARYNPSARDYDSGVHSVYFELLAENGFVTFGLFLGLMISSIFSLRGMRRRLRGRDPQGLTNYSHALEISIAAYAISGAFLEKAGFDLLYHVLAMVIVLKVLAANSLREQSSAERAEAPKPAPVVVKPSRSPSLVGPGR